MTDRELAEERIREAALTGDKADLRGLDLTGADFRGRTLSRVVFGDHEGSEPPAQLAEATFRGARLERCRFAHCDLDRGDFRAACLRHCDLRYAVVRSGSFEEAELVGCDLYRSAFEGGTVFESTRLVDVSLDHARLDGIVDLSPDGLGPARGRQYLLQEDAAAYERFLRAGRWYRRLERSDPPEARRFLETALARGPDDAATVYRRLAGMWSGQGEFRHAGWAYVRARRLERRSLSSAHDGTDTDRVQWALMGAADWVSGFGEHPLRVIRAAGLLVLFPAVVYALTGAVHDADGVTRDPADMLLYSLGQMTTTAPDRLAAAGWLVELGGELQTLLGIVLLGLFGFVLGQRIRMS